jgi:hypothetical protein
MPRVNIPKSGMGLFPKGPSTPEIEKLASSKRYLTAIDKSRKMIEDKIDAIKKEKHGPFTEAKKIEKLFDAVMHHANNRSPQFGDPEILKAMTPDKDMDMDRDAVRRFKADIGKVFWDRHIAHEDRTLGNDFSDMDEKEMAVIADPNSPLDDVQTAVNARIESQWDSDYGEAREVYSEMLDKLQAKKRAALKKQDKKKADFYDLMIRDVSGVDEDHSLR